MTSGGARAVPDAPDVPGRSTGVSAGRARLVAVNRFYAPDHAPTAQLLADLAEHLGGAGVDVTVVTGRQRYDDPKAELPPRDVRGGVAIHRVPTTRFGRHWLPGRALDYLSFCLFAWLALRRQLRPGDVLLAKTDPPLLSVIAWLAARSRGARLVNWCQDLFPEVAAALGLGWAGGVLGRPLRTVRNRSLRAAELNVALCAPMAARLRAEGVPAGRIAVIHNWADGGVVRPVPAERNPLRRDWGLDGCRVIGYSGNLGRAHDLPALKAFVRAMAAVDPALVFLLIGGGAGAATLEAWARAEGIAGLVTKPYQPRARLAESLSVPDLHLVSLAPACEGLIMPSKLYGALAAGRPVVALGDPSGAVPTLLREFDAGMAWTPGAEAAVQAWLERAREPATARRIRRLFEERFDRPRALQAWTTALGLDPDAAAARELGAAA